MTQVNHRSPLNWRGRFAALLFVSLALPVVAHGQDSTRRAMPPMAGMPGMQAPSPLKAKASKPVAKRRAKKPTARSRTTVRSTARPATPSPTAPKPAVVPAPHAAHDSAMADMPGMRMDVAKPDTAPEHDMSHMPGMPHAPADTGTKPGMPMNMPMPEPQHGASMNMDGPLGIPMQRTGSGTTWLPDVTPMHAYHTMSGAWELMVHGAIFGVYDKQGSARGAEQINSVNWGMLMATHPLGAGRVQLRGMVSAEPWTVGGRGYPLLLQTGETYRGQPLHDRQHPHDLFMEIAALYETAVTDRVGVSLYVAPVGEPAIGPVASPHRPSAMNDAFVPIGHHWQDATHITFGVLTAGLFTHSVRLEGSIFNGREPDENRTNFDYAGRRLDSYAGRIAWNPTPTWSFSTSYAFLASPESLDPDESVHRVGATAMNGHTFGRFGELATTFVFGANHHPGADHWEPSYLIESNLEVGGAHSVFARAEYVKKSAADLVLAPTDPTTEAGLRALSAGYVYEPPGEGVVRVGVGGRVAVNLVPASLEPYYGTRTPKGFALYLRLRPRRAASDAMQMSPATHHAAVSGTAAAPGRN